MQSTGGVIDLGMQSQLDLQQQDAESAASRLREAGRRHQYSDLRRGDKMKRVDLIKTDCGCQDLPQVVEPASCSC